MTIGKRKRALIELTERLGVEGATVHFTKGQHLMIQLPNGGRVYASASQSDWRAMRKTKANIRRVMRGGANG
jgi:ferredoxin-NADP reductase